FELPTLTIEVSPGTDLNAATNASIKTTIVARDHFTIKGDLNVSFNTHLGWDVGPQTTVSLEEQLGEKVIHAESFFSIPTNCWIVNASAGVAVQHGRFTFRIHDQKIVFRGDWANEINRK
ncbi:MAG: hypothetical protein MUC91_00740, partial [Verrucomicrobia bacterium]|nr:hypothetical protein [Verrucomicrobiota bacterium]